MDLASVGPRASPGHQISADMIAKNVGRGHEWTSCGLAYAILFALIHLSECNAQVYYVAFYVLLAEMGTVEFVNNTDQLS